LREMDEEHRKKYEEEVKTMTEKHNKHNKKLAETSGAN
jgi:hypothetical protein